MKAISLYPVPAMNILYGYKMIECRSWKTNIREEILICSTANPKLPGFISGRALCTTRILDCVPLTKEHLEAACLNKLPKDRQYYGWILEPAKIIIPFKVKGKQGFFDVSDDLIDKHRFYGVDDYEDEGLYQLQRFLDTFSHMYNFNAKYGTDEQKELAESLDCNYVKELLSQYELSADIWDEMPEKIKNSL